MSSLLRKFIVFLALSVAVSGSVMAKATDESEGKTTKSKSSLLSKKKAAKEKATTKKASKPSAKKTTAKKTTKKKAGKEQYKNITVDINRASASALSAYLVNIGPARAVAIEKYRKANGKFKSIDDLLKVDGIGKNILGDIKKNLSLSRGETSAPEGFKMGKVSKPSSGGKKAKNTKSKKASGASKTKNSLDKATGSKSKKPVKKTKTSTKKTEKK